MPLTSKNTGDSIPASDHNEIYNLLKTTTDPEWITFTHKGADIVSAGTLSLGGDGNYFDVTGTTGITAISSRQAGTMVVLQFDGAVTLTHSATLVLQGAANVTTAAGDILVFISEGGGTWRQVGWLTAAGFVTLTGSQTLTNKTLTAPTISDFTNANHDHLDADDGGTVFATEGRLISRFRNLATLNVSRTGSAGVTDFGGSFTTNVTTTADDRVHIVVHTVIQKATGGSAAILIDRGGTKLPGTHGFASAYSNSTSVISVTLDIWDNPGAGTFTYKPQISSDDANTATAGNGGQYCQYTVEVWR